MIKLIVHEAGIYSAPISVDIYRPDVVSRRKDILAGKRSKQSRMVGKSSRGVSI